MELQALQAQAQQRLSAALDLPSIEARIEAQILLREALGGVSRAWLLTHHTDTLTIEQSKSFGKLLERRLTGEPVAYILGRREFFGMEFKVTPQVLIPRPDTETLVEAALGRIPIGTPCKILDMGTGSGAIAIALAKHRPQAAVTAVDRSDAALEIARHNTATLGADNVLLRQSDWFSALGTELFDCIVSNPPYIAQADAHLDSGDLRFEPLHALASGIDGLDDVRHIAAEAPRYLKNGGWILLEHGHEQAEPVAKLLQQAGFIEIGHATDLAGILRVSFGRK